MPIAGILLALGSGLAMALAGAGLWLTLGVVAVWLASLWLSQPPPTFERSSAPKLTISRETIAPFIEPLGVPLLLLDGERIVAANRAARDALGGHVSGQDARIALRHPQAIALLGERGLSSVTVDGLTGPGSLWQLSRFAIDDRFRLIEFVNRTAEADLSKAHTDFVANASHELRTPLSSILGYLETLRDSGAVIDDETRDRFLRTMESEGRRMQGLVEDLMSLSRIEAEKHSPPAEKIDIAAVTRAAAADVAAIHGKERVKLEIVDEPAPIAGDRGQIDQLVRNLVDNAIKYADPSYPVSLAVQFEGDSVLLTVSDRGAGIPAEHLPHLTRRFYRTDPGRSRASGGTGLGLAIVKHIVERHRGKLDISSKESVGTTVTVRLPAWTGLSQ